MRIDVTKSFKGMDNGVLRVLTVGDTCDIADQSLIDVILTEGWGKESCCTEGACKDLTDLTVVELKDVADNLDIAYKDNIKKVDIIKLISSKD